MGLAYTFLFLALHLISMRSEITARKLRNLQIARSGDSVMDWNADHAGFVIAAYALSLVLVAGLIIYVFNRDARVRKRLAQFEKTKK